MVDHEERARMTITEDHLQAIEADREDHRRRADELCKQVAERDATIAELRQQRDAFESSAQVLRHRIQMAQVMLSAEEEQK